MPIDHPLNKVYDNRILIVRNSFDEYIEVINGYYPQIAKALETTKITFKMFEIDLSYGGRNFPSFYLNYHIEEQYLSIAIDFSTGLSFFANKYFFSDFKLSFSGNVPDNFDYPDNIALNEIEEWMHQTVYQNYLYEKQEL